MKKLLIIALLFIASNSFGQYRALIEKDTVSLVATKTDLSNYTPIAETSKPIRSSNVAFWGDSFTASGYGSIFAFLNNTTAFNGGINGETSVQIKGIMVADTSKYSWGTVIWAGRNDPDSNALLEIDSMVSVLGHSRYLVLSILNMPTETIGTSGYNNIISLDSTLSVTYGNHYVDARKYLISQYDPSIPEDVRDHSNDIIPTSLRIDSSNQHLNAKGDTILATYLNRFYSKTLLFDSTSAIDYDGTHFYGNVNSERKQFDFGIETVSSKNSINKSDLTKRFIDITASSDTGVYYFNGSAYQKIAMNTVLLFNSLLDSIVTYHTLDEVSGNTIDATGNTTTSSQGNLTQGVTGKINTCYTFNGSNSQINIPRFMNSSVFTYTAWIKTSSATEQAILEGDANGSIYFKVSPSGNLVLTKKAIADLGTSTGTVANGSWNFVAVSYDASGNYIFYINGVASGSGTNLQTFDFSSTNNGIGSSGGSNCFNGQIDEVGTWKRVLSPAEITILYNSGSGKSYPF